MIFGVQKETKDHETRVGLLPSEAKELVVARCLRRHKEFQRWYNNPVQLYGTTITLLVQSSYPRENTL